MGADDYTMGEVVRTLKRLEVGQTELMLKITDGLKHAVARQEYALHTGELERRLSELEERVGGIGVRTATYLGPIIAFGVGVGGIAVGLLA